MNTPTNTPAILCILDGWGHSDDPTNNAIAAANTPTWDYLRNTYPYGLINASEGEVGLPSGQMGNSEVGHMNIGAGRVVMQELPRIDAAISDGSLAENKTLCELIAKLKASGGTCHLLGLVSDGGVHAHQEHIIALAKYVSAAGVPVAIHAILDGRDTPPRSAKGYLAHLEAETQALEHVSIATICGRYFAMDRDKNWERLQPAYDAIVSGDAAEKDVNAIGGLFHAYDTLDKGDEFVPATVLGEYSGMQDGDGLLMANFRADRARQILTALLDPAFDGFARRRTVQFAAIAGMVKYSDALAPFIPALFAPQSLSNGLSETLSKHGIRQLHIAETEKYAHVTFFLNGGREEAFEGEERILIPSPSVPTYDLQPEMSAPEVADAILDSLDRKAHQVIIVNFANTDMVGHTGDIAAAAKAVEAVDSCLGKLVKKIEEIGGVMLISADHGNAEMMHDETTGQSHTAHTLNLVPLVAVGAPFKGNLSPLPTGRLSDLAPTLLHLLNIPVPAEMTGTNLLADVYEHVA